MTHLPNVASVSNDGIVRSRLSARLLKQFFVISAVLPLCAGQGNPSEVKLQVFQVEASHMGSF